VRERILHTIHGRVVLLLAVGAAVAGALVWRWPDLAAFGDAFTKVHWEWVAAAVGANLLSVLVRSIAWHFVLNEALPPPHAKHRHVFSAFSVGLLCNAVLPGRVGEVARVAVLARHVPHGRTTWASIFGSCVTHRLFDIPPTIGLVIWVLVAARIPDWALPGVEVVLGVSAALVLLAAFLAHRQRRLGMRSIDGLGRLRRLWHMALQGLRVLHSPGPAIGAASFQILGWVAQVFAVYLAFKAFDIDAPIAAAGLVLLVVNVALVFPLWPGSVGLFQAAVALALLTYGVAYHDGFVYGIGLQAIEASVGIGLGLLYLAREGISFAMLKQMPKVSVEEVEEELEGQETGLEHALPESEAQPVVPRSSE
jgi:uncharacterized membrane protein YbhN (UPF0104 family)